MKKRLLFTFSICSLLLLLSSCQDDRVAINNSSPTSNIVPSSNIITISEAQSDLESILMDIDGLNSRYQSSTRRIIKSSYSLPIKTNKSRSGESDTTLVHIFNFENNDGYAIMSGDTRIPSLIALTEKGSLEEDEEIDDPGVAIFLEGMNNLYQDPELQEYQQFEIENITGTSGPGTISSSYTTYGDWENIVYTQGGNCPVKWGQRDPYNKYCPVKNGTATLTGCVATSVAQLMAIYKHPQSYDGYSLSWDDMTFRKYIDFCSTKGQDDIARLMQLIGQKKNLDTSYGTNSSSAKTQNIIRTLKSFGYSKPGILEDYRTSNIISELMNGYGVLMCGYSHKTISRFLGIKINTEYSGGHQWLAHGLLERRREVKHFKANGTYDYSSYESQWYPLCNWGWNGYRDGYYLSAAFDTTMGSEFPDGTAPSRADNPPEGSSDYFYQYKLSTITGIRK